MASPQMTASTPKTVNTAETSFKVALGAAFFTSLALAGIRSRTRYQRFHVLFIDDILFLLSVACLIAGVGMIYSNLPYLYEGSQVDLGIVPPTPEFLSSFPSNQKIQDAAVVLLETNIWCIKFVFLAFFRGLVRKLRSLEIWWWCVCVMLVLSIPIGAFAVIIACPYTSFDALRTKCMSNQAISVFIAHSVVDIFTDAIIISIPIALLWKAQMSLGQKLAIGSLLSLSVFTIIISIIIISVAKASRPWFLFWVAMEACFAVIAASLSVCRTLFKSRRSKRANPGREPDAGIPNNVPHISLPSLPSIMSDSRWSPAERTQAFDQSHLTQFEMMTSSGWTSRTS